MPILSKSIPFERQDRQDRQDEIHLLFQVSNDGDRTMVEEAITIGGLYRHFKGGLYRVHHLAVDTRRAQGREETVVVYECLPDRGFFVRPLSMFLETIERDGERFRRFVEEEPETDPGSSQIPRLP